MIALLAAAALASDCPTICDARRLRPFFDKLAQLRRGGGRAVRIVQIGDSHTAGDQITGAWRALLQARYGDGGRGVLAAGRPYQGYLTRGVTATQATGWAVSGIFGPSWRGPASPALGLSGFSLTATEDAAHLSLGADRGSFDSFTACLLTGPGAGWATLELGPARRDLLLDAARPGTRCETIVGSAAVAGLTAAAGVTVTSWSTERAAAGVVLSNLGTVGAQLVHAAREDDSVVAAEVAAYKPDLIVLAFGTNEAFSPRFSAAEYAVRLRAGIARLQRLAPGVPMLLLGAPDSATKQVALQTGEDGVSPACDGGEWRPTAALGTVQAIQRQIAGEAGVTYWDWRAAMGGACAALDWATRPTPWMRPDRVHFTSAGAAEIARLLQADLDRAAAEVVGLHPTPAQAGVQTR